MHVKFIDFLRIFFLISILFLAFHFITWYLFTSNIFGRQDNLYVGDLGRLKYEIESLHPRGIEYTLHKKHFNQQNWQGEKIDILTIGDSFSNADASGTNPYYQDFIANTYNLNILNLKEQKDPIALLISLHNNGWLAQNKPKYIILQRVERFALDLIRYPHNWHSYKNTPLELLIAELRTKNPHIPNLHFINTANYKFYLNQLSNIQKKQSFNNIYKFELNSDLFSLSSFSNQLLVLGTDIHNSVDKNSSAIKELNNTLNQLQSLLLKDNIQLIFMPAVDKFDLYYDFIQNNSMQKNYFFDLLRLEHKDYIFVDTKAILMPAIQNGLKDIFYADDTHWSNKASEIIVHNKIFKQLFSQKEKHTNVSKSH